LKLANTKKNEVRPADLTPNSDTVIYTFKQIGD